MTQYIDKFAAVAQIEKIIADETESIKSFRHNKNTYKVQSGNARMGVLIYILHLFDTLGKNLFKHADDEELPEYDREVIVLTQPYPLKDSEFAVSFAHRPNPKGWDGKSITTGKVEHYTPKTYGEGGWNIPDVKYWLDIELQKEIEFKQKGE